MFDAKRVEARDDLGAFEFVDPTHVLLENNQCCNASTLFSHAVKLPSMMAIRCCFLVVVFFYTTDSPRFAMPLPLQVLRSYIYKVRHDIAKHVNVRLKSTRYHLCKEKKTTKWLDSKEKETL